jgi:hypothetical protein
MGTTMSIKKELLNELTEEQLRKLAEHKGIKLDLSMIQKTYYAQMNEKDKLVDIITGHKRTTVSEIEKYIATGKI